VDRKGTLAALNKKTGEVVWRTKDLTDEAQYSSPIVIEHEGKKQVVQLVGQKVFGVDPVTGGVLWKALVPRTCGGDSDADRWR
jgi:outer membrane protein assembly factor BamB